MSFLYYGGVDRMTTGGINLETSTLKLLLVATGSGNYVASQTGDSTLADIPVDSRIGTPGTLAGTGISGGVFDAQDLTIDNTQYAQVGALVIYAEGGSSPYVETECYLLAYIDGATGLPYSTGGAAVPVTWSNGANKIAKIG